MKATSRIAEGAIEIQWYPVERTQSVPTARLFYEMFVLRNLVFHRLVRQETASRLDSKIVKCEEFKKFELGECTRANK